MALSRHSSDAKLVCTSGPRSGSEFPLVDGEVIIGRSLDVPISIPDTSVSRKHVLLRRGPAGWAASDMGSGNGTLINGDSVADETVLRNGDVLTLGDSEFSYIELRDALAADPAAGGAIVPVRRSSSAALARRPSGARMSRSIRGIPPLDIERAARRKKQMLIGGIVLFVLVAGLLGIKLFQRRQQERQERELAAEQARKAALGAIFQDGKNLLREGKMKAARAKFEELQAKNPNYPMLRDYLESTTKEIPNEDKLAEAEAALSRDEPGAASKLVAEVSADTQLFKKGILQLRTRIDERVTARLAEGRKILDSAATSTLEDMQKLKALADDILVGYPNHRDATDFKVNAEASIAELTKPKAPKVVAGPKPWLDAEKSFRAGDLGDALDIAEDCAETKKPCKQMLAQLKLFGERYKKLETMKADALNELLDLEEKLGGGQRGEFGKKIGLKLAGTYYKNASGARAAGQWSRASEYARRTLRADPDHVGAQSITSELRGQAKDVFMRAYTIKDTSPDEALKLFLDVVEMTPPDNEYHQKAKSWAAKLQR